MFYRLPFPDSLQMEKVRKLAGVQADIALFLNEMRDDLEQPSAMGDLRTGWEAYLDEHKPTGGALVNPSRKSLSVRKARCGTPSPTQSDIEGVCSPHWYTTHSDDGDLSCRRQEREAESAERGGSGSGGSA